MQILLAALFMWLHCPESFVVKSHFKIRLVMDDAAPPLEIVFNTIPLAAAV